MDSLKDNWLTDGLIDLEYKKYILLGYLKKVKESFGRVELYPQLSDLIFHYRNLMALKENKTLIFESFPKELSLENLRNLEVNYKKMIEDDSVMQEIESIMEFAMPRFKDSMEEGSSIYEFVESKVELSPVGVVPLYSDEGYMFISQPPENETYVYRYQMTVYQNSVEQMRGLQTQHMFTTRYTYSNTYEQMKLRLIRQYAELPNPAAFLVLSKMRFPHQQTLVPVAKRLLVKHLSKSE
ncbi:MAG TPA: hypothetical protein PLR06_04780 [Cyclobacteriaceae bacterium]|nr:hypothetical protein [Cyclobacteriaceae bacterium]